MSKRHSIHCAGYRGSAPWNEAVCDCEEYEWSDLPADFMMKSHGHVAKRPDGVLARCGGPGLCATCELERYYLQLLGNYRKATNQRFIAAKELALDIIQAIGGDRKFWAETQQKTVAKVEKMLIESRVSE